MDAGKESLWPKINAEVGEIAQVLEGNLEGNLSYWHSHMSFNTSICMEQIEIF